MPWWDNSPRACLEQTHLALILRKSTPHKSPTGRNECVRCAYYPLISCWFTVFHSHSSRDTHSFNVFYIYAGKLARQKFLPWGLKHTTSLYLLCMNARVRVPQRFLQAIIRVPVFRQQISCCLKCFSRYVKGISICLKLTPFLSLIGIFSFLFF